MEPLVEEAAKKAAVAWLRASDDGVERLVWCAWLGGAILVVTGPGEQEVPGLAEASSVEVGLRGDHGGRIVTCTAEVSRLDPADPVWDELVPQLAGKRLNGAGTTEEQVRRWAETCVVVRLTLDGPTTALPDDGQAAPPRPTTATRRPRMPFRLHRVRGAKRR